MAKRTGKKVERLLKKRTGVVKSLPSMERLVRASLLKRNFKCKNPNCPCQRGAKKHGPYYWLTVSKGDKRKQIYIPLGSEKQAKQWISNYNKVWQGIEDISSINFELIKLGKIGK